MRGNLICRSGPDTTGYYMDAQLERSLHPSFPRMRPARSYLLKVGYGVESRNKARRDGGNRLGLWPTISA